MPVTSEMPVNEVPHLGKYASSNVDRQDTSGGLWEIPSPWIESIIELNDLLNASTVDLKLVGKRIREIRALESLVVRLCDCLGVEPQESIQNIEEAAVLLGSERLRALILSAALLRRGGDGSQQLSELGRHCLISGMLCDRIARWSGYGHPDVAFLAGFSHPFGQIESANRCTWESCLCGADFKPEESESLASSKDEKLPLDIAREVGSAFRRVFERHQDRTHVRVDERLAGIVAAACQLSPKRFQTRHQKGCAASAVPGDCDYVLQACLPGLDASGRTRLAQIIMMDCRELVPLFEFGYSELAEIDSAEMALEETE